MNHYFLLGISFFLFYDFRFGSFTTREQVKNWWSPLCTDFRSDDRLICHRKIVIYCRKCLFIVYFSVCDCCLYLSLSLCLYSFFLPIKNSNYPFFSLDLCLWLRLSVCNAAGSASNDDVLVFAPHTHTRLMHAGDWCWNWYQLCCEHSIWRVTWGTWEWCIQMQHTHSQFTIFIVIFLY